MEFRTFARKSLVSVVAVSGLLLSTLTPASAHVVAKADTYEAGSTAIVTFGFGHGCGESPTTSLAIQIPEEFVSVNPVLAPGWHIEREMETLATPVAGSHGQEITERTATVTFTADEPVENGIFGMVSLRLTLPEDAAGETIYFPVVQGCEEGEWAWIEIPEDGQDPHALEAPAPSITIVEPAEDGNGH
ncbi:MAG: YcnI family protein [Thermomicrobiales bacterium]|nr:YcnI family protein [Thermomicrobiales bacterium]MCO5226177.1 YcnI family protein [Thermomicrobiales bacterium]MCO5228708.1 YcnI family protein [Thermomicrobiales bacterium]